MSRLDRLMATTPATTTRTRKPKRPPMPTVSSMEPRKPKPDVPKSLFDVDQPMDFKTLMDKPVKVTSDTSVLIIEIPYKLSMGTKQGYIQVTFEDRPPSVITQELKDAAFRWTSRHGLWYGKTDRLPARYTQ